MSIAILAFTDRALSLANELAEWESCQIFTTRAIGRGSAVLTQVDCIHTLMTERFHSFEAWIFIGALGICVRAIAPQVRDKTTDPAVLNVDEEGRFVQSVLSGHVGGANALTKRLAARLGAMPVITTASDVQNLWALDLLGDQHDWKVEARPGMSEAIALFVNRRPTALLLEGRDEGTDALERSKPGHVEVFRRLEDIPMERFALLLSVGCRMHSVPVPVVQYFPRVLVLGIGCTQGVDAKALERSVREQLAKAALSPLAVRTLATATVKQDEAALRQLSRLWSLELRVVPDEVLRVQAVPSPSSLVQERVGVPSVAEAAALAVAEGSLIMPKCKISLQPGFHTLAVAVKGNWERRGRVMIVGAGPGDPELISVKGRQLLEQADFILYAGSLVPLALTACCKPGAEIRSSAGLDLQAQLRVMEEHYQRGHLIVRLHTGDPCLYGAIQEQMAEFDLRGWDYQIVPGISAFQAAAARLRSQFTVPEEVQTVILTRGEGATPVPERERLSDLARHRATLCIYLSAALAEEVEAQLLTHYPPETPLAILHRVTWPDEQVVRGRLCDLSQLMAAYGFSRTTLIVVGTAIDARRGRSHLYDASKSHLFREARQEGTAP